MALIKYKVLQSEVSDGISQLPKKAIPLGVWVDDKGKTVVAFIMKYEDWAEEFSEEALKEAQVEAVIHNVEEIKDNKEEGVSNA